MSPQLRVGNLVLAGIAASLLVSGCAGPSVAVNHRLVRYRPLVSGTALTPPAATPAATVLADTNGAAVAVVATSAVAVVSESYGVLRSLGAGDRIVIYLRGIPKQEEIKDIIDGVGEVTLPYIGEMKLVGLTTSDAERLIESTYVSRGIYKQVNVIVVAEDEVYFVQGEVARQGKFPLSGPVTLLQTISEAGGYSPFANRKKIKVIRGDVVLFYNARDIADGEVPDPPIQADDIIEVLRKW